MTNDYMFRAILQKNQKVLRGLVINLEMQVANEHDWTDRSMLYLCRAYDQLKKGEEYKTLLPAIHIGFLDFHVFPKYPEFYGTYQLLNTKTYHLYSDKFTLRVVDLTCIDIATDEDKSYGIDHWARLFKATTWEELRMLAKDDTFLNEAAQSLYECNSDDLIQEQCRARETRLFFERATQAKLEELTEENIQLTNENTQLNDEITRLKALLKAHNIDL